MRLSWPWRPRSAATKHLVERVTTALSGQQSGIVLVDDMEVGLDVVNAYAAEHLEIHTTNAAEIAARVRNAGAVFVGPYAPVSSRLLKPGQPRAPRPAAGAGHRRVGWLGLPQECPLH